MDAKLFRIPTEPNFYKSLQSSTPAVETHTHNLQLPTPDSRFPGWAAPMSDGRLVTDYNNHCSKNIPVGKQYPTTLWMQRNSDEIIQYSRKSNAIAVGSVFPFDSTVVPPPLATVSCTRSSCKMVPTGAEGGIGVERHENEFPELFGTFSSESRFSSAKKADHTELTSNYQGGRNTIHRDKNISSAYY
jgi:hypothetical protein